MLNGQVTVATTSCYLESGCETDAINSRCDQIGYPTATITLPHLDKGVSLSGKQMRDLVYGSDGIP